MAPTCVKKSKFRIFFRMFLPLDFLTLYVIFSKTIQFLSKVFVENYFYITDIWKLAIFIKISFEKIFILDLNCCKGNILIRLKNKIRHQELHIHI